MMSRIASDIAAESRASDRSAPESRAGESRRPALFDLSGIDLSQRRLSRADLERWNPHRGQMALLDWVVWHSADYKQGVGLKHVREDEFWVSGHFPGRAMLPGVLMIESGAQLGVFLYNARFPRPRIAAFTHIENATFRSSVQPGEDLLLLCQEVKFAERRFVSDIQGMSGDRIVFEARITGMVVSKY